MYLSQYFVEAASSVAEYQGEKIYQGYTYDLKGKHTLKFRVLKSNPDIKQVILLYMFHFEGIICNLDGVEFKKPKGGYPALQIYVEDLEKQKNEIHVVVDLKEGDLFIGEGFVDPVGDKQYIKQGNDCALKQEKISSKLTRIYCNDSDKHNFDDLIYEIEIIE